MTSGETEAGPGAFEVPVALVRDYQRINREVAQALDDGRTLVRLTEVEGQRLLCAGLRGPWHGVVEVVGDAGPELAAGLDAPALTVHCVGSALDGAGADLKNGRLAVSGSAGDGLGARMEGGIVVVAGPCGHRVGLRQRGGLILLLGPSGRLLGDRQAGGLLVAEPRAIDTQSGRPGTGGDRVSQRMFGGDAMLDAKIREALHGLPAPFQPVWLNP